MLTPDYAVCHLCSSYLLAMTDRRSRNIWMEMLQQQNPQLEPAHSETDGPLKPLPTYINMIRTLQTPSLILRQRPEVPNQVHIAELENYHYSMHGNEKLEWGHKFQRNQSWAHRRPSGHSHGNKGSIPSGHSHGNKGSIHSRTDSI